MPDLVPHVLPAGALHCRPQPVLTAGDLRLRPWEPADAPALVAAYADPGVQHWNGAALDEAEAQAYAEVWAEHWRAERRAGWAVVRGDELAGRITLRGIDHEQGSAEVTYWVVPAARGAGVAPAAVTALAEWAFGEAGFALEGTRVSALLHDDGWHDVHLHGRVAH